MSTTPALVKSKPMTKGTATGAAVAVPRIVVQMAEEGYRLVEKNAEGEIISAGVIVSYGDVTMVVTEAEQTVIALVDDPDSGDKKAYMLAGGTLEGGLILIPGTRHENTEFEDEEGAEEGEEGEEDEDEEAEEGEDDDDEDEDEDEDEDDKK